MSKGTRWTRQDVARVSRGKTPAPIKARHEPLRASQTAFPAWCALHGLPEPVSEWRFHPVRKWRFDFAWPAYMVALEIEGGAWIGGRHTRGAGFLKDAEKYTEAAVAGWCVIRVQPKDLRTERTRGWIARAIDGRTTNNSEAI